MLFDLVSLAVREGAFSHRDGFELGGCEQIRFAAVCCKTLKLRISCQLLYPVIVQEGSGIGRVYGFPGPVQCGYLLIVCCFVDSGFVAFEPLGQDRYINTALDAVAQGGEPVRLVQHLQRDHQFTYIVQPHAHEEGVLALIGNPAAVFRIVQPLSELLRIMHHAAGVGGIIGASCFYRIYHDSHEGVQQVYDLLGQLVVVQADCSQ